MSKNVSKKALSDDFGALYSIPRSTDGFLFRGKHNSLIVSVISKQKDVVNNCDRKFLRNYVIDEGIPFLASSGLDIIGRRLSSHISVCDFLAFTPGTRTATLSSPFPVDVSDVATISPGPHTRNNAVAFVRTGYGYRSLQPLVALHRQVQYLYIR
jgi:hypothetical protein